MIGRMPVSMAAPLTRTDQCKHECINLKRVPHALVHLVSPFATLRLENYKANRVLLLKRTDSHDCLFPACEAFRTRLCFFLYFVGVVKCPTTSVLRHRHCDQRSGAVVETTPGP